MSVRDGGQPNEILPSGATSSVDLLDAFADVVLRVGVALEHGRRLLVWAPVITAPLVARIVRQVYRLGSPFVDVFWSADEVYRQHLLEAPRQSLRIPQRPESSSRETESSS